MCYFRPPAAVSPRVSAIMCPVGKMVSRGILKRLDILLVFGVLALTAVGLAVFWSLSLPPADPSAKQFFHQQLVWAALAVPVMAAFLALDFRFWGRISWGLYLVNIVLLVLLLFFAEKTHGAESWFRVGPAKIQPSEFAKLFFLITFADFLSRKGRDNGYATIFSSFLFFSIPFGLIMLQPDFGTAFIFIFLFFGMLFAAGVDGVKLLATGAVILSAGLTAAPFVIKGYQLRRLFSFLNPAQDIKGAGYQLMQSKVAIGSGHIFGKGLMGGSQAHLGFLPEARTDFVFAVVCEKGGLVGGLVVLAVFIFVLHRIFLIALRAEFRFGAFIAAGVMIMAASQAAVNLMMTLGLFPITGVPLPFVSYGGSSLLTNFAAVGMALNVCMRRRKIGFM